MTEIVETIIHKKDLNRLKGNLTFKQVAKKMGISVQQLCNYNKGFTRMSQEKFNSFLRAINK